MFHLRYTDCKTSNPCNVSGLEQHTQYYIRVKASNIRGESKFSPEVAVATKGMLLKNIFLHIRYQYFLPV